MANESKILIFGATGYLGKYMVKASVSLGHPTYVYTRPITVTTDSAKLELLKEFKSMGVEIFEGTLDEHDKLLSVIRQVDVVISTLAIPQHLEQIKIIDAIKEAGNIKRFLPSDFGVEVDRIIGLPPFQPINDDKKKIRRATEAAGIPYTFVSPNCFGAYFVEILLHPHEQSEDVIVYGSGEAKAVLNFEEDVAAFTIKAATDPRVCNRVIDYRPPGNIISQLELIASWEKKSGRTLKKTHLSEEEIVKLSESLPCPDNIRVSILHSIFIKGDQMSYELEENDLEASKLYPDYKYTPIDRYLDICVVNPPTPKLTSLA
ncbi:isoeugenol synthase 1-like isoform X2 [Tasmannia lanceolata]|uniref:isoeugenol synthase 1-like isoform X2 n=1 Tax=Tasmannia lanceolata TaxID=3420 RepID=UPI0040641027